LFGLNTDGSSFTTLHLFDGLNDGANPYSSLIISGGSLFGTAAVGGIALGALGSGTVFMLNTNEIYDPANFTVHTFIGGAGGEDPLAGLASSGGQLYGTAAFGGTSGFGAIYTLATNGSGYLPIYNFTNGADGNVPASSLIISGQTLYGMAYSGGSGGAGTVYSLNTDGTGFKVLHSFNGTDGANPATGSGLILSGTVLYGTTQFNGPGGYGTVFGVNTDGSGFRNLYGFTNGADGAKPQGPLLLQGNILYGTAPTGGTNGTGTVFAVTIPPPSLQIAQAPGAITVSWTSSSLYPGLVLQQNTNLNNSNWTTSGYAITTTNGTNTVTFSPPTGMNRAFFRLLSP